MRKQKAETVRSDTVEIMLLGDIILLLVQDRGIHCDLTHSSIVSHCIIYFAVLIILVSEYVSLQLKEQCWTI